MRYLVLIGGFLLLNTACKKTSDENKLFPTNKNIISNTMNVGEYLGKINFMKCVNNYIVVTGKNTDFQTQGLLINKESKNNYLFGETREWPGKSIQGAKNEDIAVFKLENYLF